MWEIFADVMGRLATAVRVADWILPRWRRRRHAQMISALRGGETVDIRCAARFRNSGGARHRATLTLRAEGVFLSTADGTLQELQLGTAATDVELVSERAMLLCDVDGRQLEVLLRDEEGHLFRAVALSLRDRGILTTPGREGGTGPAGFEPASSHTR